MNAVLIFLGGGLGALARYGLSVWNPPTGNSIPWGTLWANLLSVLVLAVFLVCSKSESGLHKSLMTFVAIGFCGGFSTFSTFSLELFSLMSNQKWGLAFGYLSLSLLLSFGLFFTIFLVLKK